MNRVTVTVEKNSARGENLVRSTGRKPRREKNVNAVIPVITKKHKESRNVTTRVKKLAKNVNKLMNEWSENESSRGEIHEKPKLIRNRKRTASNESVIYVGSYMTPSTPQRNISIVDLTESSEYLAGIKENICPKTLRTLYFPERNFDRVSRLKKCLTTTSLITLPVTKKIDIIPKHPSTTELMTKTNKCKLAVLNIPAQYLDLSDIINMNQHGRAVLDKAKLTESDYEMIDMIIEQDRDIEMEFTLSPSTSGYDSSLHTGLSLDEVIKVYNNGFKDTEFTE
ncbi:hypothetical protein JTB14_037239 [Gonioctena quinquepunctata]|nr:hypothetical protein JTB14_037239 [Gonioctena quinquepunctata]